MRNSIIRQSMTVEPANIADIPFIMSVERSPGYQALVGHYDADEHRRRLVAPNCTYLLCRVEGQPVGFAVIRRDDDGMGTAQLHRIAVSPPGTGYGTTFLQTICQWVFAEHDVERLWLDLLPSNVRARHVYNKLGFVEEGIMRSALRLADASRIDLVLMALLREQWSGGQAQGIQSDLPTTEAPVSAT
ncbi:MULTISPECIES: GNAT family N-acetyltransferase [Rhizobium]|uniref:GNAT family N-acetyltransferase n=1 Tax=Rhizobium TaxID=379 RepID=UPI00195C494F|nr:MULTISPECIES: GNAT family N-acetyltransferase [Rhizobium]MBM7047226.1 GNAT family N-acetyltransferase [Rhizobium lusitanum]